MNAPRTVLRSKVIWRACCLLGLVGLTVTAAAGCSEPTNQQTPDVECTAEAVLARDPGTGQCEWVSSCGNTWELCADGFQCDELPSDACGLDERCRLATSTVCADCAPDVGSDGDIACGCFETTRCVSITPPPVGCAQLDEATCLRADTCRPEYGWTDGSGGGTDGAAPAPLPPGEDEGCTPDQCGEEPINEPALPDTTWGFLGCVDDAPTGCAALGEATCLTTPYCEAIYGATTCDCLAPAPGDDIDGGACYCPEPDSGFLYCQDAAEPPPPTCYDIYDEGTCWQLGCEWSYDGGTAPEPAPCLCAEDDPDCGCFMEPPPLGRCHTPTQPPPPPPSSCYDFYDEGTCTSDPSCQWHTYDGSGDRIDPCWGAWTDETGTCRSPNDGVAPEYCCDTSGGGAPMPVDGWCEPAPTSPSCYDHNDQTTCTSDPSCQWTSPDADGGAAPPPDGFVDVCYGAYVGPDGVCYNEWGDVAPDECCAQTEPAPPDECYQAATGPDGVCYDGFGNVAPEYCCGNNDPIDCTGAWRDQAGTCRGPADGEYPEYCCYDHPAPYCEPRPTTTGCESYYDTFSCMSAGCEWIDIQCDCPAGDPNCICPDSYCAAAP